MKDEQAPEARSLRLNGKTARWMSCLSHVPHRLIYRLLLVFGHHPTFHDNALRRDIAELPQRSLYKGTMEEVLLKLFNVPFYRPLTR